MNKTFYRVCNQDTKQGLWYDQQGVFTGLIHNKFSFCANANLQMPFDSDIVGWLSATKSLKELFAWFTESDISRLEKSGFFIYEYTATEFKEYQNHWVISQKTSVPIRKIELSELSVIL